MPGVCKKQHAEKAKRSKTDADAVAVSSHLLGVCDGVSEVESFGIQPDLLPRELLQECVMAAEAQLEPGGDSRAYDGLISLLVEAYRNTESHGSTTVLLASLDHSTTVPKLHILNLGDCELILMRRRGQEWVAIYRTEPQRVNGHKQHPLQLARVGEDIDPAFVEEEHAIPLIQNGSAFSALDVMEDDLVVMGSDGIFDNLFVNEIVSLVQKRVTGPPSIEELHDLAAAIVHESHVKVGTVCDTPLGKDAGGKPDDTAVIVASVIPMHSPDASATWGHMPSFRRRQAASMFGCSAGERATRCGADAEGDEESYDEDDSQLSTGQVSEGSQGSDYRSRSTECQVCALQ